MTSFPMSRQLAPRKPIVLALDTDYWAQGTVFVGFYVATGGDVAITTLDDETVVIPSVPDGTVFPTSFKAVLTAGTTASGIIGLVA